MHFSCFCNFCNHSAIIWPKIVGPFAFSTIEKRVVFPIRIEFSRQMQRYTSRKKIFRFVLTQGTFFWNASQLRPGRKINYFLWKMFGFNYEVGLLYAKEVGSFSHWVFLIVTNLNMRERKRTVVTRIFHFWTFWWKLKNFRYLHFGR